MEFNDVKGNEIKGSDSLTWRPAVYAFIIKEKKLCVIQPDWDDKYSLPGGSVEFKETLTESIQRELLEEVGLQVTSLAQPIFIDTSLFGNQQKQRYFQRLNVYYEVTAFETKPDAQLDTETTDIQWIDLSDVQPELFTHFQRNAIEKFLERNDNK